MMSNVSVTMHNITSTKETSLIKRAKKRLKVAKKRTVGGVGRRSGGDGLRHGGGHRRRIASRALEGCPLEARHLLPQRHFDLAAEQAERRCRRDDRAAQRERQRVRGRRRGNSDIKLHLVSAEDSLAWRRWRRTCASPKVIEAASGFTFLIKMLTKTLSSFWYHSCLRIECQSSTRGGDWTHLGVWVVGAAGAAATTVHVNTMY